MQRPLSSERSLFIRLADLGSSVAKAQVSSHRMQRADAGAARRNAPDALISTGT